MKRPYLLLACCLQFANLAAADATVPEDKSQSVFAPTEISLSQLLEEHAPALSQAKLDAVRYRGMPFVPPTTRAIITTTEMSDLMKSRHLGDVRTEARCRETFCVEGLSLFINGHWRTIIDAGAALAALRRDYDSHEDTDATSILFVAVRDRDRLSVWRGTSSMTNGAAHANNTLECETWDVLRRRRLTLNEVSGGRAKRILAALEKRRKEGGGFIGSIDAGGYRVETDSFRFRSGPGGPVLTLCLVYGVGAGGRILELPINLDGGDPVSVRAH